MAFISMIFASVILIVLFIGFIALVIAVILDSIWIIRTAMKKKTHVLLQILAILITLPAMWMFVIPVGSVFLLGTSMQMEEEIRFARAENKVYAKKNWHENGFDYKGMHLVRADFLSIPSDAKKIEEGVLITPEENKYYISYVENDNDFDIYTIERISYGKYCDEEQVEEIQEYYRNPDNLIVEVEDWTDNDNKKLDIDVDPEIVLAVRELYDNHGAGLCYGDLDECGASYYFKVHSEDKFFYESVELKEYDGHLVLPWTSSGGSFSAIILPKEMEDYFYERL